MSAVGGTGPGGVSPIGGERSPASRYGTPKFQKADNRSDSEDEIDEGHIDTDYEEVPLEHAALPPIDPDNIVPDNSDTASLSSVIISNEEVALRPEDPDVSDTVSLHSVTINPLPQSIDVTPEIQATQSLATIGKLLSGSANIAVILQDNLASATSQSEKKLVKYDNTATSLDITQQLASSIASGASMVAPSPGNSGAQSTFVVSAAVSSGVGIFCTLSTVNEVNVTNDIIAKKEFQLVNSSNKYEKQELENELKDLRSHVEVLVGMAVMGAIDSGASSSAFGIQVSRTMVPAAVNAANALGVVASVVGIVVSSYQLYSNAEKGKALAVKMGKSNGLYDSKSLMAMTTQDPLLRTVFEDVCLLRDKNLTVQKNDLVVSNIQNGLILSGSVLGLAQSLVIIVAGSASLVITCLGVGAIIGVGIGIVIGLSYYASKKRAAIRNKFARLTAHASNDATKLTQLNREWNYLSDLEKFDAASSVLDKKIAEIRKKIKAASKLIATSTFDEEKGNFEVALKGYQNQLNELMRMQKVNVEERLKRLDENLRAIISRPDGKGTDLIYNILLNLGLSHDQIDLGDQNRLINQLHKALVA